MSASEAGSGRSGPLGGFDPERFRLRRGKVFEALDRGVMVLPAAPVRYRSRDTEYSYRPDSELFYLTGLTGPGAVALLRGHADEERFVLFVRERDEEAERWSGPRPGPEAAGELAGADAAYPLGELTERFGELVKDARSLHYRLGGDRRLRDLVVEAMERARRRGPRKGVGPRAVVDPGEILDPLRRVKDDEEVARIREAAAVTVEGFLEAAPLVAPGVGEWRIESALATAFRRGGARGPGFNPIVGSGAHACTLHYDANRDVLPPNSQVLVDAGAEVNLYHGDVTRTFPTSGRFPAPAREAYALVEAARRAGVEAVEPGAPVADVHDAALAVLVDGMRELGLVEGDRDRVLEEESYKEFFPHQTSHWLGLDVHDPGDYARDGASVVLEPGMVLTVEPGLYVPEDTEDSGAAFAGVGVRVEDDVLVTAEGREVLTGELPTAVDRVEAMVG